MATLSLALSFAALLLSVYGHMPLAILCLICAFVAFMSKASNALH